MTTACEHLPRTGTVTSQQHAVSDEQYAATRVCDLPACIQEALDWVERMSHRPAFHLPDKAVLS